MKHRSTLGSCLQHHVLVHVSFKSHHNWVLHTCTCHSILSAVSWWSFLSIVNFPLMLWKGQVSGVSGDGSMPVQSHGVCACISLAYMESLCSTITCPDSTLKICILWMHSPSWVLRFYKYYVFLRRSSEKSRGGSIWVDWSLHEIRIDSMALRYFLQLRSFLSNLHIHFPSLLCFRQMCLVLAKFSLPFPFPRPCECSWKFRQWLRFPEWHLALRYAHSR